jgi:hypothetical protein
MSKINLKNNIINEIFLEKNKEGKYDWKKQ